MSKSEDLISKLKEQIAFLTAELERAEARSNSLWSRIHEAFILEGNGKDEADFWADKIAEIVSSWINSQREILTQRIVSTGAMPPYTDCLNDLIVGLTAPGSAPPPLPKELAELAQTPVAGPSLAPTDALPPPPPTFNGLSADAQPGPPKMKRVYVPKPIPGAVPLPLPPENKPQ